MKHNKYPQKEKPPQTLEAANSTPTDIQFSPSAEEVSRRAYFAYVNAGSRPGQDVQHWLAAEAELTAERNRTRTHNFHNRT